MTHTGFSQIAWPSFGAEPQNYELSWLNDWRWWGGRRHGWHWVLCFAV